MKSFSRDKGGFHHDKSFNSEDITISNSPKIKEYKNWPIVDLDVFFGEIKYLRKNDCQSYLN